jgi:hypothetical protein
VPENLATARRLRQHAGVKTFSAMNSSFVRGAAILFFLFIYPGLCRAEWDGPGITHVPICGDAAFQVGDGLWVGSPQALEEPLEEKDLNLLRGQKGFTGLTDAQINAKMLKIRQEVWDAINLIAQFDPRLGYCLESVFLNRRLFLEFSDRQVAGAVDGNSLGKAADDCGNGSIALKAYPCDSVPEYSRDFVRMLSVLVHEGTHLSQTWPTVYFDVTTMNWRLWKQEMEKRVLFQSNELEASRKERAITKGMWDAMRGIRLRGEIPEDNPALFLHIPPVVRAIAQKFLNETPPAERAAKAGAIENSLSEVFGATDQVIACRTLVKNKAEEMRDRPEPTDRFELLPLQQEWLTFIRGTGWFQQIGDEVLNGIFSISLLAGGGGAEANQVRQYDANGNVMPLTISGLTNITDVAFFNERTILIGGLSTTVGEGAVYTLTDTNLDNFFDMPSLTLVQRISGLAGGVSLAVDRTAGRGFCLGRQTGNLYSLSPAPPALPASLTLLGGINQAPVLDENYYILAPPGGGEIFFVPEFGGCITEGVQWSSCPSTGVITNNFRTVRPLELCEVAPVFLDKPFAGDKYVRCGGTPGADVQLFNDAVVPPALLGTTKTDSRGNGLFYVSAISAGFKLRLHDMGTLEDSVEYRPGQPITDPSHNIVLPTGIYVPGLANPVIQPPLFRAPPHTDFRIDFSEHATWASGESVIGTVPGDGFAMPPVNFTTIEEQMPATGFWRIKWTGRRDIVPDGRTFTLTAGITTTINLNEGECDFDSSDCRSSAIYTILDRGGLHEDACRLSADGRSLECTPLLTHNPSCTADIIRVRRTDVVSNELQDFFIQVYSNRRALIPSSPGPLGLMDIPCLIIGGAPYPIYQFTLSNSEIDLCTEPHWHSGGVAYTLYEGTATQEPAGSCGWGLVEDIEFDFVLVSTAAWLNFVSAHPPPVNIYN